MIAILTLACVLPLAACAFSNQSSQAESADCGTALAESRNAFKREDYASVISVGRSYLRACEADITSDIRAQAKLMLGTALQRVAQDDEAVAVLDEAANQNGDAVPNELRLRALGKIIEISSLNADWERAEKAVKDIGALSVVRGSVEEGLALLWGAYFDYRKRNFENVQARFEAAMNIFRENQGFPSEDHAEAAHRLGSYMWTKGEFSSAYKLQAEASEERAFVLGENHTVVTESLNDLALNESAQGRYIEALNTHFHVVDIRKKIFGERSKRIATSYNNIAFIYYHIGSYAEAEKYHKMSLAIRVDSDGYRSASATIAKKNIALVYMKQKKFEEAEALLQESLNDRVELYGEHNLNTAYALKDIGVLRIFQGNYVEARRYLEKALAIYLKNCSDTDCNYAGSTQMMLGVALLELRQYDKARENLYASLYKFTRSKAEKSKAEAFYNISRLEAAASNNNDAIFFAKQSVNTLQLLRGGIAGSERWLSRDFLTENSKIYRHLARLLAENARLDECDQVLMMLKEDEYFDFIRRDEGRDDPRTTTATLNSNEADAAAQLAAAVEGTSVDFASALASVATALHSAKGGEVAQLRMERINDDSSIREQIPELFDDGAVLLQFVVTEDATTIFVTTADRKAAHIVKVSVKDLRTKVLAFREALMNPGLDPVTPGRDLYELLLAPVMSDLEQARAKMLVVSLDDALRYIPISALHDGSGWLVERYPVAMLTQAAKANLGTRPQIVWKVAGFGATQGAGGLAPLEAVRDELSGIVRNKGSQGVLPGTVALDDDFTGAAVKLAVEQHYPVLHMATHFVFKPDVESYLLLGDGDKISLADIDKRTYSFPRVDLLALSACETGKIGTDANGREVEGLGVAVQRAGARSVLASLWPVADASTAVLMRRFYDLRQARPDLGKGEALRQAQLSMISGQGLDPVEAGIILRGRLPNGYKPEARSSNNEYVIDSARPFAHPNFWAPFILMGNWL